ncbi:hypothetical protein ACFSTC_43110 [Nonomuraea ferruginea]
MDPKELRPRLRWIAVAWGVAVACVVAGVVLFVTGIVNTVEDIAPSTTFAAGETVTVSLDPDDRPSVYVSTDARVNYRCEISGGPGQARLVNAPGSQTVTARQPDVGADPAGQRARRGRVPAHLRHPGTG